MEVDHLKDVDLGDEPRPFLRARVVMAAAFPGDLVGSSLSSNRRFEPRCIQTRSGGSRISA
jgi:hypothetical protein